MNEREWSQQCGENPSDDANYRKAFPCFLSGSLPGAIKDPDPEVEKENRETNRQIKPTPQNCLCKSTHHV
jgi:hypothetical protein